MSRMQWSFNFKGAFVAALCAIAFGTATAEAAEALAGGGGSTNRWVATWSAAPLEPGPNMTIDSLFFNDHSQSFENQTVRNIAHTSVAAGAFAFACRMRLVTNRCASARPRWRCGVPDTQSTRPRAAG